MIFLSSTVIVLILKSMPIVVINVAAAEQTGLEGVGVEEGEKMEGHQ